MSPRVLSRLNFGRSLCNVHFRVVLGLRRRTTKPFAGNNKNGMPILPSSKGRVRQRIVAQTASRRIHELDRGPVEFTGDLEMEGGLKVFDHRSKTRLAERPIAFVPTALAVAELVEEFQGIRIGFDRGSFHGLCPTRTSYSMNAREMRWPRAAKNHLVRLQSNSKYVQQEKRVRFQRLSIKVPYSASCCSAILRSPVSSLPLRWKCRSTVKKSREPPGTSVRRWPSPSSTSA